MGATAVTDGSSSSPPLPTSPADYLGDWGNPVLPLLRGPARSGGAIAAMAALVAGSLVVSEATAYGVGATQIALVAALVAALVVGLVYARYKLVDMRRYSPPGIRIETDRVTGVYGPGPAPRGMAPVVELPFGERTLLRSQSRWFTPPVVANLGDAARAVGRQGTGPGPARIAVLFVTPENLRRIESAYRAWSEREHVSDDQLVPVRPAPRSSATASTFPGSPGAGGTEFVQWLENRLVADVDGKRVTSRLNPGHHAARVGIGDSGVYLPNRLGGVRRIPWAELCGPSQQAFGNFWNITPSKPDGSQAVWGYVEVNQAVATAIAAHPSCPRRNMTRADVERLGLRSDGAAGGQRPRS